MTVKQLSLYFLSDQKPHVRNDEVVTRLKLEAFEK